MPNLVRLTAELLETSLHSPFVTSQGATSAARAVALTLFTDDPALTGYGESVPVQYVTGETVETVLKTVEAMREEVRNASVEDYLTDAADWLLRHPEAPSARCGIEMALFDLAAKQDGVRLVEFWGGEGREVESDLTIPIVADALELTEKAWARGMRTFKLKVGGEGLEADVRRVLSLAKAFPEAKFRVDANQGFTVEEAVAFAERIMEAGAAVQLLEQPVKADDFAGMVAVAERSPLPVFADESVKTPADAHRCASTPIAGINCKINKSGITGAKAIAAISREAGKQTMIGCMLETRYSIFHALALACGTGLFDYVDLDSHLLLDEPGDNPYFTQAGDRLTLKG